jgi:hypothetical protein
MLGAPPGADRQQRAELYEGLLGHPNPEVHALTLDALDRENRQHEITALAELYRLRPPL